MRRTVEGLFLKSAILIIAVTALAKLYSAGGTAQILDHLDPIFLVLNRVMITVVGMIEFVVVGVLLINRNASVKLLTVAWLSANFVIYRFGLWFLQIKKPCSCLGTVTDLLPIDPATIDQGMKVLVIYLFLGSILLLLQNPGGEKCAYTKMSAQEF
jgi:hypothetical protein